MSYARILPDKQWWHLVNGNEVTLSRHQDPVFAAKFGSSEPYPAVIPTTRETLSGDTSYRINEQWWKHFLAINSSSEAARRNNGGIINWAANKEWAQGEIVPLNPDPLPIIEGMNSVGNYVEVLELKDKRVRVKTWKLSDTPTGNWHTHPTKYIKFSSISKEGEIGNAPDGVLTYVPFISKEGSVWLPLEALEMDVGLPNEEAMTTKAIGTRAIGLDISKYDLRYHFEVKPVDFVIQRASYGLKRDERFDLLYSDIQPISIRGAYHYFNTGVGWRAQADHFLGVIAGKSFHFLALDYETFYNNLNAASAEDARRIMLHLRAETGKQVLLYCNPNVYENYLRPYGDWMSEWPLWISQWYSKWWFANRATGPRLPKGRSDWAFWQYGGDYQHPTGLWSVPGYNQGPDWGVGTKHVDLDLFNGSPSELRAWAGVDTDEPKIPPLASREKEFRLNEIDRLEAYAEARRAELV